MIELISKYINITISIFIFLKVALFFCVFVKSISKQSIAKKKFNTSSIIVAPLNTKALVIIEILKAAIYSWCLLLDKASIKNLDNELLIKGNNIVNYNNFAVS